MSNQCDTVLSDGIFNKKEWRSNEYAQLVLVSRFSSMSYREAKAASSGGLEIGYAGYTLGGNYSEDEFNSFKESVKSSLNVEQILHNQSSVLLSSGDAGILEAWTGCISKSGGLTMFLEPRGDTHVAANINWVPYPGNPDTNPKVMGFTVTGARVIGDDTYTRSGTRIGIRANRLISLERPSGGEVYAALNTDLDGREAYLPPKYIEPDAKPRPIIEISMGQITRGRGVEVGGGLSVYGADVLHNGPVRTPFGHYLYTVDQPNEAEFDFEAQRGRYNLEIEYAAAQSRPIEIDVNGTVAAGAGLAVPTGTWLKQEWHRQATVNLRAGLNTIRLYRNHVFPHIRGIRLLPI